MISLAPRRLAVLLALTGTLVLSPFAAAAPMPGFDVVEVLWRHVSERLRPTDATKEGCQTNPDGKPCPGIVTPPSPKGPSRPRPSGRTSPVRPQSAP